MADDLRDLMTSALASRRRFCALLSLGAAGRLAHAAEPVLPAAAWPTRPIRLWVAYAPGGLTDEVARHLARLLSQRLDVPVLVENRPGAGGAVALEALSRAPADGQTLCLSAISPLALRAAGKTPWEDALTPVAGVMYTPMMVVGTPAFSGRRFDDLLTQGRAWPGELRWATSGQGTLGHLVLEQVSLHAGLRVTHVPYTGGGSQLNDALSGQFELLSTNVAALQLRYVAQGRLRPLAVGSPARLAVLPDVPTLAELGLPQANLVSLFGLFAPGGLAYDRLAQVHAAVQKALWQREMRDRLLAASNVPFDGDPHDFARLVSQQVAVMRRLNEGEALRR